MVLRAFSRKLWFAIRISMCLNRRMEFLEVARHAMGQLISLQTSIEKSIDFLPLELWKLHSSFLYRFSMRKALISCLWSSGSCTAHSIKISIEKSIDFLPLELWKLHSSFLYRLSLRKTLIYCPWSSGSPTSFLKYFH